MSVEMFDYLDEILALQAAVFGKLWTERKLPISFWNSCF